MIHARDRALHCPMQSTITFMFQAGCVFTWLQWVILHSTPQRTELWAMTGEALLQHPLSNPHITAATAVILGFEVKALTGFAGSFEGMRDVKAYLFTTFKTVKNACMKPRWSFSSCSKTDVKLISGRAWIKYHIWSVQFSYVFNAL